MQNNNDDDALDVPSLPLDFEAMFSTEGKARRMAGLRELVTASAAADRALAPRGSKDSTPSPAGPPVIGLHGGFPPASSFPFVKLTATLRDGSVVEVEDPAEVREENFLFPFFFSSFDLLFRPPFLLSHTLLSLFSLSLFFESPKDLRRPAVLGRAPRVQAPAIVGREARPGAALASRGRLGLL